MLTRMCAFPLRPEETRRSVSHGGLLSSPFTVPGIFVLRSGPGRWIDVLRNGKTIRIRRA